MSPSRTTAATISSAAKIDLSPRIPLHPLQGIFFAKVLPILSDSNLMKFLFALLLITVATAAEKRPNILWLTGEDHGTQFGCYGDTYATTPNVDAFAKRSLRYTNASSNAPICAPARTCIITGMYSPAIGGHHMRSGVDLPNWLELLPETLRKAGYFCTNASKTDYNINGNHNKYWDECSGKAHYKNRGEGQPFFAVFNQTCSHESQIRNKNENPHHDPALAPVPPYHPDTPEVRKDWAQYYDRLTKLDTWVGKQLDDLQKAGLAENTIVFFYGDHGSGMPRHKRYVGWSGLHVPLLVHIPDSLAHLRPEGYQTGGTSDRLVAFVDLAPTVLSLCGINKKDYHQGGAFLGKDIEKAPEYSFGFVGRADEHPDESRSVFDGRYLYIHNFVPSLPQLKGLTYQMETRTTSQWKELFDAGKLNAVQAEPWTAPKAQNLLFDLQTDPHEIKNLLTEKPEIAKRMAAALGDYFTRTRDLGLLSEGHLQHATSTMKLTPGDFAKTPGYLEVTQRFKAGESITSHPGSLASGTPEEQLATLHNLRGSLKEDSPNFLRVLLIDSLISLESKPEYVDQLLVLADPVKSDVYTALNAYQALRKAKNMTPAQYGVLKAINTKPVKTAPARVSSYAQRCKELLLEEFKNKH